MARGDIKIDYDTNDLVFKKSTSNVVNAVTFGAWGIPQIGRLRVEIPENQSLNDSWKTYETYVDGYIDTSSVAGSYDMYVEYFYKTGSGQEIVIKLLPMTVFEDGESEPTTMIVSEFIAINDTIAANKESLKIKYFSSTSESFFYKTVFLGDFNVKEDIQQNQYMLLNINEGAILQNPTSGVGAANYAQSPDYDQT